MLSVATYGQISTATPGRLRTGKGPGRSREKRRSTCGAEVWGGLLGQFHGL